MSRAAAREVVALYGEWLLVQVDLDLILAASELEEHHRLSFWDAPIVEAAGVPAPPGCSPTTSGPGDGSAGSASRTRSSLESARGDG
jgi:hypothetical protein